MAAFPYVAVSASGQASTSYPGADGPALYNPGDGFIDWPLTGYYEPTLLPRGESNNLQTMDLEVPFQYEIGFFLIPTSPGEGGGNIFFLEINTYLEYNDFDSTSSIFSGLTASIACPLLTETKSYALTGQPGFTFSIPVGTGLFASPIQGFVRVSGFIMAPPSVAIDDYIRVSTYAPTYQGSISVLNTVNVSRFLEGPIYISDNAGWSVGFIQG